jgi:uracil-DNA glycosylase
MRLDKDYLMEMELLPHFEMRSMTTTSASPVTNTVRSVSVAPASPSQMQPPARSTQVIARPPIAKAAPATPVAATIDPARAAKIANLSLEELAIDAAACTACSLCKQRKQAVVGVGATTAPWLFIGEGPGEDEDRIGEPFVGQAGKLLDAMLTATGLARGREVYIANVVKCRPPGNRTPQLEEAQACAPYLDRQIALIQPKIIVALGKTAITRLTGTEATMASLRGQLHQYHGIPVIATYHPAYLLRNLPEKLKAWEDLQFAKREFSKLT